jgi:hypothetical protein
MSKYVLSLTVLLFVAHAGLAGDVTVEWQNYDNHLYNSHGTDMRTGSSRFQLVLDLNGDTDVAKMISSNYWAIAAEDAQTTSYGSDDDVTLPAQNTGWQFVAGYGYVYKLSLYDELLYASKKFYFRFFNHAQVAQATEGGLVYNTAGTWVTAPDALNPGQATVSFGRTGPENGNIAGSVDGSHADGWATMAAPGSLVVPMGTLFRLH